MQYKEVKKILLEDDSVAKEYNLPDPIEAIFFRMDQMNWSSADLARLTGFSPSRISEYLNYKRKIPLSFIRAYHRIADATPLEILIQDYDI